MSGPLPAPSRCLTDAEIASLRAAVPGTLPEALAVHVAGCSRCQERALAGGAPRRPLRKRPSPPSPQRTLLLAFAALVMIVLFFWSLRYLAGRAH